MANARDPRAKQRLLQQQGTLNPRPQRVAHPLFQNNDFFDPHDLVQVKYEMLRQVGVEKDSVSQSAQSFGFSRPSYYQAQLAFETGGLPGLVPRKRGPHRAHKLTEEVLDFVEVARSSLPVPRYPDLADRIFEQFGVRVHPRSIERQLMRRQEKRR